MSDDDINLSVTSDGTTSSEWSFVDSLENSENEYVHSFINDRCDYCDIECGGDDFLKIINNEKPIPTSILHSILREPCYECPMCAVLLEGIN
jgi:hypothetical protein